MKTAIIPVPLNVPDESYDVIFKIAEAEGITVEEWIVKKFMPIIEGGLEVLWKQILS